LDNITGKITYWNIFEKYSGKMKKLKEIKVFTETLFWRECTVFQTVYQKSEKTK
jgi:hypothetical protein